MGKIKSFAKNYKLSIPLIAILFIVAGFLWFGRGDSELESDFIVAERMTVAQEVDVTGRVVSSSNADLAFERSGKVARVYVKVGDTINAGDTLITLESADLSADVALAQAQLEREEVKLADLQSGTRPEDIAITESELSSARASLQDAAREAVYSLQDAYTKSDTAVRNRVDTFFNNPRTSAPKLAFDINNQVLQLKIEAGRAQVETTLMAFSKDVENLSAANDLKAAFVKVKNHLAAIKLFLDDLALGVNSLTATASLTQTTIDSYKADTSSARTDISAAISGVSSAETSIQSAQSNVAVKEQQLALKKAGSTQADIDAQLVVIKQQESIVAARRAALSKNILRAPISGTISRQDAKVGEIIGAGSPIVSIISSGEFQIEVSVPETDIAKIRLGDTAEVTLDAYTDDIVFNANVVRLDPAETVIDGVATYTVILQFMERDDRIKSGMTADVLIGGERRENVIAVPQRAVITRDGEKFVQVIEGDHVVDKPVKTGFRGSDGNIEIVEGVTEGDKVVIFNSAN